MELRGRQQQPSGGTLRGRETGQQCATCPVITLQLYWSLWTALGPASGAGSLWAPGHAGHAMLSWAPWFPTWSGGRKEQEGVGYSLYGGFYGKDKTVQGKQCRTG